MRTRSKEQEDYLLRMIQQAAEAIRRLREMLTTTPSAGLTVRQEITSETDQLLGIQAPVLRRVDAVTAVRLLGSRRRAELWADLVELDADACDRAGDAAAGTARRERAAALRAAIVSLESDA